MKKLVLTLFVILLLAGCAKQKEGEPVFAFSEPNQTQSNFVEGMNQKNRAVEEKDVSACDVISEPLIKEECYAEVKIMLGDPTACQHYQGQEYTCYYKIALVQNDSSYCNLSSYDTNLCYEMFAKMSGEYRACAEIQGIFMRENCYWQIAKDTSNPEICANIETERTRLRCEYESSRS